MFHEIPKTMLDRMRTLEEKDAKDRQDGTAHAKRLRQVPPETGKFLAILAANAPKGAFLEIGTSAGYSALWLSLACKSRDAKLVTFELLPEKVKLARETFKKTHVEEHVELVNGDARGHLAEYEEIAFCFLDAEKEMYAEFYDLIVPNLVSGGLLVADNAISHMEALEDVIQRADEDEKVDSVVVPIGRGLLVCRKGE